MNSSFKSSMGKKGVFFDFNGTAQVGKVVIVDSNSGDYKAWAGKNPIIKRFSEFDWNWFEQ